MNSPDRDVYPGYAACDHDRPHDGDRSGNDKQNLDSAAGPPAADDAAARTTASAEDTPAGILRRRLQAVADVLAREPDAYAPGDGVTDESAPVPGGTVSELLLGLLHRLNRTRRLDESWLLLVGLTGAFPTADDVHGLLRELRSADPGHVIETLLHRGYHIAKSADTFTRGVHIVEDTTLVDVDFCARHDLNTGIQRVVRATLPHWAEHDVHLVAWTSLAGGYRFLSVTESRRVLSWATKDEWDDISRADPAIADTAGPDGTVVVPWRCTVVLPEVPNSAALTRLSALAEVSGNRVAAIGYDCIPVVSADMLSLQAPEPFIAFLAMLKHADVVAAISRTAAEEFAGFVDMLPTQGLTGPAVVACPLPLDIPVPEVPDPVPAPEEDPVVLVVGSHDPRKNHLAVLHAAQLLWREGHRFTLEFVGSGQVAEFDMALTRLKARRMPIIDSRGAGDAYLWQAYRRARFTVFPSLHEGYGLPVAESVVSGTPVIATNYGSIAEIAAQLGGGVVPVDPRDDAALVAAMRWMLIDSQAVHQVMHGVREESRRTWADYAHDLWQILTDPDHAAAAQPVEVSHG